MMDNDGEDDNMTTDDDDDDDVTWRWQASRIAVSGQKTRFTVYIVKSQGNYPTDKILRKKDKVLNKQMLGRTCDMLIMWCLREVG